MFVGELYLGVMKNILLEITKTFIIISAVLIAAGLFAAWVGKHYIILNAAG